MSLLRIVAGQVGQIVKARLQDAAVRAIWLVFALVAVLFALLCATGAGWLWLASLMAPWYAALIVGSAWFALAFLAVLAARYRAPPKPHAPAEPVQSGLEEARAQGEALARRVEPEHLIMLGLIAGVTAGRRFGRGTRED